MSISDWIKKILDDFFGVCEATTRRGGRCSRGKQFGTNFCWQHQNYAYEQRSDDYPETEVHPSEIDDDTRMAILLITELGYKAAAKANHPDHGGIVPWNICAGRSPTGTDAR